MNLLAEEIEWAETGAAYDGAEHRGVSYAKYLSALREIQSLRRLLTDNESDYAGQHRYESVETNID